MKPITIGQKFNNIARRGQIKFKGLSRGWRFNQKFNNVGQKFRDVGHKAGKHNQGFVRRNWAWSSGAATRKFNPEYGKFSRQRFNDTGLRRKYTPSTTVRAVNLW